MCIFAKSKEGGCRDYSVAKPSLTRLVPTGTRVDAGTGVIVELQYAPPQLCRLQHQDSNDSRESAYG
jgi:hypothetical protein